MAQAATLGKSAALRSPEGCYIGSMDVTSFWHFLCWRHVTCVDVCTAAGSNFSYEEVAEVPNAFVAGIALVVLTLSCALFICKPLYPIINRLLPYIGAGVSPHLCSYPLLGVVPHQRRTSQPGGTGLEPHTPGIC